MSEGEATASATEAPTTEATSGEPDWSNLPDNISGREAARLIEEHKAKKSGAQATAPKEEKAEPKNDVKDAAQEAMRKYKVKVDGAEIEVDENELKRGYTHQRAAAREMTDAKRLRKQSEEFVAMLKDPEKFFELAEKMGHDTRTLAEKKLARALEEELMDPKERELKAAKARLEEFERRENEAREKAKAEHLAQLEKKYASEYENQFLSALKDSGLPPTKPMIGEMAKYIGRAASLGFKMTANEAAMLVKEDIKIAQARLFKDADAQTLLGILGDDLANKIRAYDVSRLKSPEEFLRTPERSESAPKKKAPKPDSKSISLADRIRFRTS